MPSPVPPCQHQLSTIIDIGYGCLIGIMSAVQHQRCWVTARPVRLGRRAANATGRANSFKGKAFINIIYL